MTSKTKEEMKLYMREYNKRPEVILRKKIRDTPKNRKKLREGSKNSRLKKLYNLSIEDYNKMAEQQNNKCAICGKEETNTFKGKRVYLSVDHIKKQGKLENYYVKIVMYL